MQRATTGGTTSSCQYDQIVRAISGAGTPSPPNHRTDGSATAATGRCAMSHASTITITANASIKRGVVTTQPEALTRAATQEATAHCAVQGKRFRQVDLKESPSGLLAPRAETALTFVCE